MSYVRCQRCGRPTCPECQRQAAVGVQCVDCVREQSRTMRTGRTTFGGRAREGRPVVTLTLIGICVAVYLLQLLPGTDITERFMFVPALAESEQYRFITSAFLHSPSWPVHIIFNMIVLYQVGPYLEAQLGRLRYLGVYLVCALGGSVGVLVLADPTVPSSWFRGVVGASGAVFGLFGALLVIQHRLRQDTAGLVVFVGINFVLGFLLPNVAWQGHLGGLLTGAALGAVLAAPVRANRAAVQLIGSLAVVAVLVVLVAWKLSAV